MFTLQQGRPMKEENILPKERKCYDFLDKLGVSYLRVRHPVADTMEECRKIESVLGAAICKNLFLCNRQQTDFYLLLMPGNKPFKTKELSKQLGVSRLSFAGPDAMLSLLDITPGSVSVLGLLNDENKRVRLILDEDILKDTCFGCHPCINTSSIKIEIKDLLDKILPALGRSYTVVRLEGQE